MKAFNFKKFVDQIHKPFEDEINRDEVNSLLRLDEGYEIDKGISSGKRLKLERIRFSGAKKSESFIHDQKFEPGVCIWIGDNSMGKSSIFKLIKLCLTGSNSLEADVKKWIDQVFLEFYIGERIFTSKADLTGNLKGSLFMLSIDQLLDEALENKNEFQRWEAYGESQYAQSLQNLFFSEFDYYSLRWTTKKSAKDSIDLGEAGTSWKTYFKAILLETQDYNQLVYGAQSSKIIQMLFGLELTYPINRLTVKKDLRYNDLAKLKNTVGIQNPSALAIEIKKVEKQLSQIIEREIHIRKEIDKNKDYSSLSRASKDLIIQHQKLQGDYRSLYKVRRLDENALFEWEEKIQTQRNQYTQLRKERDSLIKKRAKLEEYLAIGSFFSNLDVQCCPHCDHEITLAEKQEEKEHKSCSLCHHPVDPAREIDKSEFDAKIGNLNEEQRHLQRQIDQIAHSGKSLKEKIAEFEQKIKLKSSQLEDLHLANLKIEGQVDSINTEMQAFQATFQGYQNELLKLSETKGALKQKIKDDQEKLHKLKDSKEAKKIETEIKIISFALERLKEEREERGKNIIELFERTLLAQLQRFGLKHYTDAKINRAFNLTFEKHGQRVSFENISPGEQVRVKLAFYLSIIKLDITHRYGRHPRFIILDTPAKEEADKVFLKGLKDTLRDIEVQFKDELQLFVGTAERELEGTLSDKKQHIREPGQPFF